MACWMLLRFMSVPCLGQSGGYVVFANKILSTLGPLGRVKGYSNGAQHSQSLVVVLSLAKSTTSNSHLQSHDDEWELRGCRYPLVACGIAKSLASWCPALPCDSGRISKEICIKAPQKRHFPWPLCLLRVHKASLQGCNS